MDDLFTRLTDDLARYWNNARRITALLAQMVTLPPWAAPAVALTSLLALVLISGVALASLGVLLTALLTAHLLLEHVFGISVSVPGKA